MNSKRLLLAALLIAPVVSWYGNAHTIGNDETLHAFEAVEPHMGTLFRIKLYAQNEQQAQIGFRAAFERVSRLDDALSDYKPESELNRLTRNKVDMPVPVSGDLFRLLQAAQKTAEQTGGAFDVTVGRYTHLWRQLRKESRIPDAETLQKIAPECGFRKLHLHPEKQSVLLDVPGMQLDVGGIAKGYAADEALMILQHLGIKRALVAASGDLVFGDAPPGKTGWRIGVDSLDNAGQPFTRVLLLKNAAVSTSGDTEQHTDVGGKRFSHILDPRTGMALTNQLTVTVVASTGTQADATDTAISVLGLEAGLRFVEEQAGMSALIVDRAVHPATIKTSRRFDLLPVLQGEGL